MRRALPQMVAWFASATAIVVAVGYLVTRYGSPGFWMAIPTVLVPVFVVLLLLPLVVHRFLPPPPTWAETLARTTGEARLPPWAGRLFAIGPAWLLGALVCWLGLGATATTTAGLLGWGALTVLLGALTRFVHRSATDDESVRRARARCLPGGGDDPLIVWVQQQGRSDSSLEIALLAESVFGKPEPIVVDSAQLALQPPETRAAIEHAADAFVFEFEPEFTPLDSGSWAAERLQMAVGRAICRLERIQREAPGLFRQACLMVNPATVFAKLPTEFSRELDEVLARGPCPIAVVRRGALETDRSSEGALVAFIQQVARMRAIRAALPTPVAAHAEQALAAAFPACGVLVRRVLRSSSDVEGVLLILNAFEAYLHHHVLGLVLALEHASLVSDRFPDELQAVTGGTLVALLRRLLKDARLSASLRTAWSRRVRDRGTGTVDAVAAQLGIGTGQLRGRLSPLESSELLVAIRNQAAHGGLSPQSAAGILGPLLGAVLDIVATVSPTGVVTTRADGTAETTLRVDGEQIWSGPGSPGIIERNGALYLLHAVRAARLEYIGYESGDALQPSVVQVARTEAPPAIERGAANPALDPAKAAPVFVQPDERATTLDDLEALPPGPRRTRDLLAHWTALGDHGALRTRLSDLSFLADAMAHAPGPALRAWGAIEEASGESAGGRVLIRTYAHVIARPGAHRELLQPLQALLHLTGHTAAAAALERCGHGTRAPTFGGRKARDETGLSARLDAARGSLESGVPEDLGPVLEACEADARRADDVEAIAATLELRAHWSMVERLASSSGALDAYAQFLVKHAMRGRLAALHRLRASHQSAIGDAKAEMAELEMEEELLRLLEDEEGLARNAPRQAELLDSVPAELDLGIRMDMQRDLSSRAMELLSEQTPGEELRSALRIAALAASGWNERRLWRRHRDVCRRLGDLAGELASLRIEADLLRDAGRARPMLHLVTRALGIARRLGLHGELAELQRDRVMLLAHTGQIAAARDELEEALTALAPDRCLGWEAVARRAELLLQGAVFELDAGEPARALALVKEVDASRTSFANSALADAVLEVRARVLAAQRAPEAEAARRSQLAASRVHQDRERHAGGQVALAVLVAERSPMEAVALLEAAVATEGVSWSRPAIPSRVVPPSRDYAASAYAADAFAVTRALERRGRRERRLDLARRALFVRAQLHQGFLAAEWARFTAARLPGGADPAARGAQTRHEGPDDIVVSIDGSGTHTSIEAAVTAARTGSVVRVRPGQYHEAAVAIRRSLTIVGDGPTESIVVTTRGGIAIQSSNVRIQRLTLRAFADADAYCIAFLDRGAVIEDCDISSESLACVFAGALSDGQSGTVRIRNCRIHGGSEGGVFVLDGGRAVLEKCAVSGHAKAGIEVHKGRVSLKHCELRNGKSAAVLALEEARVELEDCEIVGHASDAVSATDHASIRVRRTRIHDQLHFGIGLSGFAKASVEACEITKSGWSGIGVMSRGPASFKRCSASDGASNGVLVSNGARPTFEACSFIDNAKHGAVVREGADPVFRSCTFARCDRSVTVEGAARGTFEDCTVEENRGPAELDGSNPVFRRCTFRTGTSGGLLAHSQALGLFEDCTFVGQKLSAVNIRSAANPTFRRCTFRENGEADPFAS